MVRKRKRLRKRIRIRQLSGSWIRILGTLNRGIADGILQLRTVGVSMARSPN